MRRRRIRYQRLGQFNQTGRQFGPPADTFHGTPPPGRLWLDLSEREYERLHTALGEEWEWQDGVRMRFAVRGAA